MIVTDVEVGGRATVAYVAEFGPQASHVGSAAVRARPRMADRPLLNAPYIEGAIAVVERGNIPVVEKARRCQDAGAAAVIVINTDEEPMMTRGHRHSDGWVDAGGDIEIPVLVVPRSAAGLFDGAPVTRIGFGVASADLSRLGRRRSSRGTKYFGGIFCAPTRMETHDDATLYSGIKIKR